MASRSSAAIDLPWMHRENLSPWGHGKFNKETWKTNSKNPEAESRELRPPDITRLEFRECWETIDLGRSLAAFRPQNSRRLHEKVPPHVGRSDDLTAKRVSGWEEGCENVLFCYVHSLLSPCGGVLVSTWKVRWRRHAEDGSLAS